MSGGHYDYAYLRVMDFSDRLLDEVQREDISQKAKEARLKFVDHLKKVTEAMRTIEYVDSDDSSPDDEIQPILDCLPRI